MHTAQCNSPPPHPALSSPVLSAPLMTQFAAPADLLLHAVTAGTPSYLSKVENYSPEKNILLKRQFSEPNPYYLLRKGCEVMSDVYDHINIHYHALYYQSES